MDTLRNFWALTLNVWRNGILGVDVSRIVTVVAILAASFLLRGLFARLVIAQLKAWIRRSKTRLDDQIIAAIEGPIRFVPVILGLFMSIAP